jgi:DNA-binding transcriptional LysR family regulator
MELRQLRYFVTVAEELHFGKAAERLNIVQPAVSQQVARLERELGLALLDRSSRHVRLTGDGERMLPEARAVLAAVDRATDVAAKLASGSSGRLRIGTAAGQRERLERGLKVLRELGPDVDIKVSSGTAAEHVDAIRTGELDVALVRGEVTAADVRTVELWRDPLSVVLPSSYRADDGVKLIDLAALPLRLPADPWLREYVVRACREAGFEPVLGRPVHDLEAAIVEMSAGAEAWTVVYGTACAAADGEPLWMGPFAPPLDAPGNLVVTMDRQPGCVDGLVAAFS